MFFSLLTLVLSSSTKVWMFTFSCLDWLSLICRYHFINFETSSSLSLTIVSYASFFLPFPSKTLIIRVIGLMLNPHFYSLLHIFYLSVSVLCKNFYGSIFQFAALLSVFNLPLQPSMLVSVFSFLKVLFCSFSW